MFPVNKLHQIPKYAFKEAFLGQICPKKNTFLSRLLISGSNMKNMHMPKINNFCESLKYDP